MSSIKTSCQNCMWAKRDAGGVQIDCNIGATKKLKYEPTSPDFTILGLCSKKVENNLTKSALEAILFVHQTKQHLCKVFVFGSDEEFISSLLNKIQTSKEVISDKQIIFPNIRTNILISDTPETIIRKRAETAYFCLAKNSFDQRAVDYLDKLVNYDLEKVLCLNFNGTYLINTAFAMWAKNLTVNQMIDSLKKTDYYFEFFTKDYNENNDSNS